MKTKHPSEISYQNLPLLYPKLFGKNILCFECGDGWLGLIAALCCDLDAIGESVRIRQIKEKFGALRFYADTNSEKASQLIEFYEHLSSHVCENCGSMISTRMYTIGWLRTICNDCADRLYGKKKAAAYRESATK